MIAGNGGRARGSLPRLLRILLAAILAVAAVTPALAADLRPSARVTRWVNVRQGPGTDTPAIARLEPGQSAELIDTVPGWYQVRLADGTTGYVSRGWVVRTDEALVRATVYRVHMIDVGTGLSVFVEGPGFAILYDAGSNDDKAQGAANRVLAYIRHARPDLTTFDHVILSHPHEDHVSLLPDMVMIYQVRNLWDSGRDHINCQYHALLRVARDKQIPYHDADGLPGPHQVHVPEGTCAGRLIPAHDIVLPHAGHIQAGVPVALGPDARMTFLYADAQRFPSPNENSLVMALDLGRTRVLFMGDAEAGGRKDPTVAPAPNSPEGKLLACCRASLRSDIVIAGHHGSKTSSRTATLDAAGAYIFLVSSGPHKYSGTSLPDREVIDEFGRRGTVYATYGHDGTCGGAAKVGPDNDNRPGGCDNLILTIDGAGHVAARYDGGPD